MAAPPGSRINLAFGDVYTPPDGEAVALDFNDQAIPLGYLGVGYQGGVGLPRVRLNTSWLQPSSAGGGATVGVPGIEKEAQRVFPAGWPDSSVPAPTYVRWRRYLAPSGWAANDTPPVVTLRYAGGYQPAPGSNVILNFAEQLSPPPGESVVLEFGAVGYGRVLGATAGNTSAFGDPALYKPDQVRAIGIAPPPAGVPKVEGSVRYVRLNTGIASPGAGNPRLSNQAAQILPVGLVATAFGLGLVFNWRQYVSVESHDSLKTGLPFVQGGVKYVTPSGLYAAEHGAVSVLNTTANQAAFPVGVTAPDIPGPHVSPRTLFPSGIAGGIGVPMVQRNPSPAGFDSMQWGRPLIDYRSKLAIPASIAAPESGYPRVFDPTQKLLVPSLLQAGVFGDTRLANKSLRIVARGWDQLEMSPWASLESNRRPLASSGWLSTQIGSAEIKNKTPSIAPAGFDSLAPAGPATGIGYSVRYIAPAGVRLDSYGAPLLTKTPQIEPSGFAGEVGLPTIWPRVRRVEVRGADDWRVPDPNVWFRYRKLSINGFDNLTAGSPTVEHGNRTVLAVGAPHDGYGAPWISNADRTIHPASIFENFATGHMVGGLRYLRPAGFDAARFGERIIPEIQRAYPLGFRELWGDAYIGNHTQTVAPNGITTTQQPEDRWGKARVWNSRQYVSMLYDPDSGLNPPIWPQWTLIENRDRFVRAVGQLMARHGLVAIDNKARQILPVSVEAPGWSQGQKAGMVAFRIRSLHLEGVDAPYISTWGRVYNDAAVLSAHGASATSWGLPSVANTRRFYDRVGGFDSAWFGYPMVADRIRVLSIESRYGINPPRIELPRVKLYTRYMDATGFDASRYGNNSLSIHRNLITPRWRLENLYGDATVRNLTPEVGARGRDSQEFGNSSVRLQWRPVTPAETFTQLFGRSGIAYRDRSLSLSGFRAGAFGDKLVVTKTGAPPYSTQNISLIGRQLATGEWLEGNGIPVPGDLGSADPTPQVPRPIINQQVIYVVQEAPMTLWGSAVVKANTIRVEPGYQEYTIGEPSVSLRVRRITVGPFADIEAELPRPRLSPHTIYAVVEAPEQAIRNHPPAHLHVVLSEVVFGSAEVSLQHRRIAHYDLYTQSSYGAATVQNKRHYLRPTGFATFRSGWHVLPGSQEATQFGSADSAAVGIPSVAPPPYTGPQTIGMPGLNAAAFGNQLVEFRDRRVFAAGHDSAQLGTWRPGDEPYMWQGLRVGPLMPTIAGGLDASVLGQAWVSFRVREVALQGFDAFLCQYDLTAFDQRMRVRRSDPPRPFQTIKPVGLAAFGQAVPDIKPGRHYIRPDGNSDQYRKGAF